MSTDCSGDCSGLPEGAIETAADVVGSAEAGGLGVGDARPTVSSDAEEVGVAVAAGVALGVGDATVGLADAGIDGETDAATVGVGSGDAVGRHVHDGDRRRLSPARMVDDDQLLAIARPEDGLRLGGEIDRLVLDGRG